MNKFMFLLFFLISGILLFQESIVLVFKDAQRKQGNIVLLFESNNKQYIFDAAKSNLQPYVFYVAGTSATVLPNEKLINHRFLVNFSFWPTDKSIKYILSVKEIGSIPSLE